MLHLYRRHKETCKYASNPYHKNCKCPIWMRGVLDDKPLKESMKLRSWERAEAQKRLLEAPPEIRKEIALEQTTFERARGLFIANMQGEGRQPDTIRKYRLMFDGLEKFAAANGVRHIQDFTFEKLVDFRGGWKEKGVNTRNKKLDRLKAFFSFCHEAGYIIKNPAKAIKLGASDTAMPNPFTAKEQAHILAKPQVARIRCFTHVLFYSALRISDACMLRPEDFDGSRIRRVNKKNKRTVLIPLPPTLKAELDRLPLNGGYYFLIGESTNVSTQTDAWRTVMNDMFKADVPGFHCHRFRHTAAVNWLTANPPLTIEEVAGLLGNSVKVVEKHYATWCGARQQTVEDKLAKTWETRARLVRVK